MITHARHMIGRATKISRWLPVRDLQSLAGQARPLFLAILAPRFFLRELHYVIGDRWSGKVRMTKRRHAKMDKGTCSVKRKAIPRSMETTYLNTDNSGYGWGAVLNSHKETSGFSSQCDEAMHITWKELKAVCLEVKALLAHLADINVLLHEGNQAVCYIRTHFTATGHDDRATQTLGPLGRERYQRQSSLHPIGGKRLGRPTMHTTRQ
jgi:hypothetical protein